MTNPVFTELAAAIRDAQCVHVVGAGTSAGPRPVTGSIGLGAPVGIVSHVPDELVITVLAGTPVREIAEVLARSRQRLRLPNVGTIGGAVATRRNGLHPMTNASLPNTVLMTTSVSGRGEVFVTGGPTVKNVSGFDLTKVLTGSWGIFAVLAEITLRVEPIPACSRWFTGTGPDALQSVAHLFRPAVSHTIGERVVVCLEGHPDDVAEQATLLRDCSETDPPGANDHLAATNATSSPPTLDGSGPEADIVRRMKDLFDPHGKVNPHLTSPAAEQVSS